ncbi:MAG: aminotransferase class I/II-fold pyridoxal phosphate-dependent enzyme [Spirochaetia bacterium]|nr:aminotransferase class I/II-fold pyridoxal phosphate-dependent enzyme [Spirochaetia bacterium]
MNEKTANIKNQKDISLRLNHKVRELKPSGIREFFDVVAHRKDCISLGVGEPDFVSPQAVIESGIEALREGYTHYTGNQGLLSLRKEISRYLQKEYNVYYDPNEEIIVTVGVSQAVDLALRSVINQSDGVLFAKPSYVSYDPMILLSGGEPQPVSTSAQDNFLMNAKSLEKQMKENTKILFLNYPANPTGASFNHKQLQEISDFAIENDLLVISDEIYAELSYEFQHIPISAFNGMKERTVLLGGFSKGFAMTGWRIGYACGPTEWIKAMLKIHQYSMLCAPTLGQIAAEAALKNGIEDRDNMKEAYIKRRDLIVKGFNSMGLSCNMPAGAFYVFPNIEKTNLTSMEFAKTLLDKKNVAVVPGTAFGQEGEGFIRCSYATSLKEIEIALEKISEFVK